MSAINNSRPEFNTLVIRGATSNEVPREAAGGQVVAWSAGHALAEQFPLEEFVQDLADGCYEDESIESIQARAERAIDLSKRQRDQGWLEREGRTDG